MQFHLLLVTFSNRTPFYERLNTNINMLNFILHTPSEKKLLASVLGNVKNSDNDEFLLYWLMT